MVDNVELDSGSGGAVLATDDISGVQHQRIKIQYGADGSATDVSDTDPLPIDDAGGSLTVDNATLAVVGGGVEASALRVTVASDSTGTISVDDGGGSLTVDGAVTANAGTDLNTSALAVETGGNLATVAGAVSGTEMQVDVVASLPVGANSIGAVTANAGTDLNTSALALETGGNLATVAGAVSGTEMQVDVVASLPAGTNNIGDVDVDSIVPGVAATNLGKAADAVAGSTDTGVAILGVRDDEQAAVGTDGDYVQLRTDQFGNLKTTQLPDATSAVKYAIVDAASSGDNTLVAAAGAGTKIRVLSLMIVSAGTVDARFESGAGGTALSGQMTLATNSGFTLPYNPAGWFETADNVLLNLELSAAVSVDGMLTYVEV